MTAKHDRILLVARRLPRARVTVAEHLVLPGYPRERVLAAAFRLLDLGFFRIGSEQYADENGSYGLATMRREHVSIDGGTVVFDYPAMNGKQRIQHLADDDLRAVVRGAASLQHILGNGSNRDRAPGFNIGGSC